MTTPLSDPISDRDIYDALDIDHHIENTSSKDICKFIIHDGLDSYKNLNTIEDFVDQAIKSTDLAFHLSNTKGRMLTIENKRLARFFSQMNFCIMAHDSSLVYCPQVQIFFDACHAVGISGRWSCFTSPEDPCTLTPHTSCADLFNALIQEVRKRYHSKDHQYRLRMFKGNVRRRQARALMWEHALFKWRSRHLMLLLTLSYKAQYRPEVTLEQLQADLFRLLNNRRHNDLLNGIEAYAWKIEEGGRVGLHVHLLMIYRNASHRDITFTERIGQYWESVATDGKGQYNNENKHKASPWRVKFGNCTGQINHYDESARAGLRRLLTYLAKSDQYLKHKRTAKARVFQFSQIPQRSMAGRPRSQTHVPIDAACQQVALPDTECMRLACN